MPCLVAKHLNFFIKKTGYCELPPPPKENSIFLNKINIPNFLKVDWRNILRGIFGRTREKFIFIMI